jgi:preprotein translocase subunit SecY
LFSYFYTSIVFKPKEISDNLQKQGGFVPGLRPGKETSDYLENIVNKIVFIGAMFLAIVAILPFIIEAFTGITTIVIGGTGILIVVSVIIETMKQIDSQLVMQNYENY